MEELSLREAADRLGVHYMTAYRHVRTGRLPARQVDGQWRIRATDLEQVLRPVPRPARRQGLPTARRRLLDRLVAGDEAGAWSVVEAALVGGLDPVGAHLELLAPAMRAVGDQWAEGTLTLDQEHRASAVTHRLIGRLGPRFLRPGRRRGTVVLAGAPDDHHTLPVTLAADVVRAAGFWVIDLGGAVPPADLARAVAGADSLVAVGICTSVTGRDGAVAEAIAAVRAEVPGAPVFVGGAAADGGLVERVGADGTAADAAGLVALLAPRE